MIDSTVNERVVAAIAADGYAIEPDFLDANVVRALRERVEALAVQGLLAPAGVGRGTGRVARRDIRGDGIHWLADAAEDPSERPLFDALEGLRTAINRELMLGLFEFEGHYAVYPAGARYARHRDRFRDDDARVLSLVLYLNLSWQTGDGGELRLYVDDVAARDIMPAGGTLVAFLSGRFDHEVLPAARERLSIAGWYRRRV